MAYFLAVFSPETHAAFTATDRRVMGFRKRQQMAATRVATGDLLVCYLTGVSRWVGLLRIDGRVFGDATPLFVERKDPYVVRLPVVPVIWLPAAQGVAIHDAGVWDALSFTMKHERRSSLWTGSVRTSLSPIKPEDGALLERVMTARASAG